MVVFEHENPFTTTPAEALADDPVLGEVSEVWHDQRSLYGPGFVAVSAVVFGWLPETWWAPLAIGSSLVSLVGVILFPLAFPTFSTVGAVAVNLAVLLAVGWLHWTPSDLAA